MSVTTILGPDYLYTIAWLYGLDAVSPERAQVLELGCGDGQRLAAQAALWPQAQFIGVELATETVAAAPRQTMDNLTLLHLMPEQVVAAISGPFDYIMIHGAFRFLDNATRDALLAYCQQQLAPRGLIAQS